MKNLIVIYIILTIILFQNLIVPYPDYYHKLSYNTNSSSTIFPVHFRFTDDNGTRLSLTSVQMVIFNLTQVLYAGPAIPTGLVYLFPGVYSFYGQSLKYGFNATLVNVTGPMNVTVKLVPYTLGNLVDTKHNRQYRRPTDPSLVLYVVFGINQSDRLSPVNNLPQGATPSYSGSQGVSPGMAPCPARWVLWKTSPVNSKNGWVQGILQGAVFSWAGEAGIENQPTVTQSTTIYSYVSYNGGPVSESSAVTLGSSTTVSLPTVSQGSDYNVYMNAQFFDYIYREYNCVNQYLGQEREVFEMYQSSTWYENGYYVTNLSDYNFKPFESIVVSSGQSYSVTYITFSQIGTQAQSFSAMLSLSISPGITGGEYGGSFDLAGYTNLYSQTQGTEVMYTITAYGSCDGYEVYNSGWVLGFGAAPGC
jgi:hypothetical protein